MIKDSRGRESKTLRFVTVAFWLVTARFAFGGLTTTHFTVAPMGGAEYGAAVAAILVIWLGREWTEKTGGNAT